VTSCPAFLKLLVSHSCWQISSSTTSIFIFLTIEKLVDLPAHLLSEDQQGPFPTLIQHTMRVPLKQLVEHGGRKLPLGLLQNRTMPDFSRKKTPA
jgi:hypothetical protein